jgi:spermidine synthase
MNARLLAASLLAAVPAFAADPVNYTQRFDTLYNSLTIERRDTMVEMRARSRGSEALESAVDLADPLKLVVHYSRTVFAGMFFQPEPKRVLMIGLGGAGIHRMFTAAFPSTLLQTVELDQKVYELAQSHMGFKPTAQTPVAIQDGRLFIKRDRTQWDWLILDAYRGGFVPPHLKTEEFYRECAARLTDRGLFMSNLHATTELYYADLKTIRAVFPQVVIFETAGRGNVIVCAVKYRTPDMTNPANWPAVESLMRDVFKGRLDLTSVRNEHSPIPEAKVRAAKVLTDDFAPVEFLDAMKSNNTQDR